MLYDGVMEDNKVLSNTVNARGGGIYFESSDPTLINNVIADNQASIEGCGLYVIGSWCIRKSRSS